LSFVGNDECKILAKGTRRVVNALRERRGLTQEYIQIREMPIGSAKARGVVVVY